MGNALCAPCIQVYNERRNAAIIAKDREEDKQIETLERLVKSWQTESIEETSRLAKEIDAKNIEIKAVLASDSPEKTKAVKLEALVLTRNELDKQLSQQSKRLASRGALVTYVAGAKSRVIDGRDLSYFSEVAAEVPAMQLTAEFESKGDKADEVLQKMRDLVESGDEAGQTLDADAALSTAQADVIQLLKEGKAQQPSAKPVLKEANSSHAADVLRAAQSRALGLGTRKAVPKQKLASRGAADAMAMT